MRQRGFSLIELIVTVVVLALLIGLSLPSMAAWIRDTRIRNIAEGLQQGLNKARNEAVRRNAAIGFWLVKPSTNDPKVIANTCTLSSASGAWVISAASPASHCADGTPTIIAVHSVGDSGSGLTVSALTGGITPVAANSVIFNGFGQVANAATAIATVTVVSATSGARNLTVKISSGGRVRTCDPLVVSTDPRAC